jgi:Cd2+/Zn2+-exporting ATPase
MSCPCALVLSVPLAFFSGIGAAGRKGILFKGGASIEALAQIKTVAMDKTGTLTKGEFTLQPCDEQLLALCAACEQGSTHPIARSIVEAAKEKRIALRQPESVEEIPGHGICAVLEGKQVLCGNKKLLTRFGVDTQLLPQTDGVLVACDGEYLGCLQVSDSLKPEAKAAVAQLKKIGLTLAMLTGDTQKNASFTAGQAGIENVYSRLLPEEKLSVLQQLRQRYGAVLFVGDGINDSPVLSGADVGAAMGTGADAAIEAADVVFMTSELSAVPAAVTLARRTKAVAWQNVAFALAVKLLVMVLGLLGFANLWLAVFADSGVALLCIVNSVRLLHR